jgi:hypothetical protein
VAGPRPQAHGPEGGAPAEILDGGLAGGRGRSGAGGVGGALDLEHAFDGGTGSRVRSMTISGHFDKRRSSRRRAPAARASSSTAMAGTVFSVVVVVVGVAAVLALALVPAWGRRDREDEEAARRFYDEHGRWPDEPAER